MSNLIYMVGQISPKFQETYEWRKRIRKEFVDVPEIQFIDPCANPFNEKLVKEHRYAIAGDKRSFGIDVLPAKDFTFCKKSTMAIANLNQYDPDKPLLGSFFELAWYFTMPEKTVIGIAENQSEYICQHPFVQQAVTVWVTNEYDAAYIVKKYFTGA
jgi:hypothetical protein